MEQPGQPQDASEASDGVVDSFYEITVGGGDWAPLYAALCSFWVGQATDSDVDRAGSLDRLERHFQHNLKLLEQLPSKPRRPWRTLLPDMPVAALLFDKSAAIIDLNDEARELLAVAPGVRAMLSPRDKISLRGALRLLLVDADRSLVPISLMDIGALAVRFVVQRIDADHHPENAGAGAKDSLFLAVAVSQQISAQQQAQLQQTFELTSAEARLCAKLASGCSLEGAATDFGVRKTTVRTQLAHVFAKTEVSSQSELVALVLRTLYAAARAQATQIAAVPVLAYVELELHGQPTHRLVQLNDGRRLGYFEYGDPNGQPALYLHGIVDTSLLRREDAAKTLGHGVRLICPERPGVGDSDPPLDVHPDAYADDLKELLQHLGCERVVLAARSMGAWDAMAFLAKYASYLQGLVLVSGRLPVTEPAHHESTGTANRAWFRTAWESPPLARLLMRAQQQYLLHFGAARIVRTNDILPAERILTDNDNYVRHMRNLWLRSGQQGARHLVEHLRLYRQVQTNPPWATCAVPTVLWHGTADTASPFAVLDAATAHFSERSVELIEGVGHRLFYLHIDRMVEVIGSLWERDQA